MERNEDLVFHDARKMSAGLRRCWPSIQWGAIAAGCEPVA